MVELLQYKAWALNEAYFNRMFPAVQKLGLDHLVKKKGQDDFLVALQAMIDIDFAHPTSHAEDMSVRIERDGQSGMPIIRSGSKNIALISIDGPLTKNGDLCSMGMRDYQSLLNRANASPSIDGILLIMDTPGGTVDGTPEFGLAIKQSSKPVGVFGDNMVASAGMWLASQASVIVGNRNNPTQFGSIGVLMGLPNYQNVIDAGNLPKMTIYRAEQSTEKARVNAIEPITQEAEAELQAELNDIADQFINTVKKGRGDKLDTNADGLFAGRMFGVYDAQKMGLIDSVGTLMTAVTKVADLAREKQKGNTPGSGNAQIDSMKFPFISAVFGKSGKAANDASAGASEQESLPNDQASMEAAEKKLADMDAEKTALKAERDAAVERATKAEASVTELTAQVSTLTKEKEALETENKTQKEELEKKPTGHLTTVIPAKEAEAKQANEAEAAKVANKYETEADKQARAIREQNQEMSTYK